jgi:hypothetical protein
MTTQQSRHRTDGRRQAAAVGSVAASIVMITIGAVQILEGISAVEADRIIVVGPNYTYQWSTTGWGVLHIIIGALIVLAGLALMTNESWARTVAIALAALSIVANFLWLPYNPWWSVLIIALDAFVIWAVSTWHPRAEI